MNKRIPFFCILFFVIVLSEYLTAQVSAACGAAVQETSVDTPKVAGDQERFFQLGNVYIGTQPDEDELKWFAENGVRLVVNVRTDSEVEEHTKEEYDETGLSGELGMNYVHLPLGGKAGYSPEDVDTLAKYISGNDAKTLVHCLAGVRASYLYVAYLILYKDVPIDDAVDIGKKMKMRIPFEDMLNFPVTRSRKAE